MSRRAVPRVLSVAGTDPTGGAGIQADLKSIAANGGYGMAVVTALVAQNTTGVRSVHVPPVAFLAEQLDAVSDDVTVDACKIGMLGAVDVIETVTAWLDRARPPIVVLDPVMVATSGDRLLDADAEDALRDMLAHADLVTPNIPELAILVGEQPARTWTEVLDQAMVLAARHRVRVLAKGGHLAGVHVPDALVGPSDEASAVVEFPGVRVETTNTHGTGCSLSSGVATTMARLGDWETAVRTTKAWLTESIREGATLDVGTGHGPVSHFAGLWQRGGLVVAPTPDQVAADWWARTADVREAIDGLPFIRGLVDGTLDRDLFDGYLAQDALYLTAYARALAEACRLAPTAAEQSFWAGGVQRALLGELASHERLLTARDAGATGRAERAETDAVTTAYLNHLHATAAHADYGTLVAAVLPCYEIYADLARRLDPVLGADHPYRDWLDPIAAPIFAESSDRAAAIVADHAAAASPDRRESMWRAYRASAEHELAFFDRAPSTTRSRTSPRTSGDVAKFSRAKPRPAEP